jgi:hypothetical protein
MATATPTMTLPNFFPQSGVTPFNPETDDTEKFLSTHESISETANWTDEAQISCLPMLLGPTAKQWFIQYRATTKPKIWAKVRDDLKNVFTSKAAPDRARSILRARNMKEGESVDSYVFAILGLCNKVSDTMPEDVKIKNIIRGLTPAYFQQAYTKGCKTIDELRDFLKSLEDAVHVYGPKAPFFQMLNNTTVQKEMQEIKSAISQLATTSIEVQNILQRTPTAPNAFVRSARSSGAGLGGTGPQRNAREQPRFGRTAGGDLICYNCRKVGHMSMNCQEPPQCHICKTSGQHKTQPSACQSNKPKAGKLAGAGPSGPALFQNKPITTVNSNPSNLHELNEIKITKSGVAVVQGILNHHPARILLDTGSGGTLVQSNYKINANFIEPIKGLTIKAANGSLMVPKGKTLMNLEIGGLHTKYPAIDMDNINYDVILGNDFLAAFNTKINYEGPTVTFNELPSVQLDISNQNATSYGVRIEQKTREEEPTLDTDSSNEEEQSSKQKFKFKLTTKTSVNPKSTCLATIMPTSETDVLEGQLYLIEPLERLLSQYGIIFGPGLIVLDKRLQAVVSISNPENYEMVLPRGITLAEGELTLIVPEESAQLNVCDLDEQVHAQHPRPLTPEQLASLKINPELSTSQKEQMLNLLSEFGDIFAFEMSELGRCDVDKFRIDTGDSRPIHSSPYRNSPKDKEEIRRQVQEMLAAGIIQHSASPWSSPVLLVPKANGTMRFTIDYRKLNKVTKRDQYPMVRVDDLLDGLQSSKIFTTIDLYAGYHQVEVHEADCEKTAFVTSDGLYEYTRLSFGLANAPAFFQRVMNACMAGLAWSTVLIYLDDLIVPGTSFEDFITNMILCSELQMKWRSMNFMMSG